MQPLTPVSHCRRLLQGLLEGGGARPAGSLGAAGGLAGLPGGCPGVHAGPGEPYPLLGPPGPQPGLLGPAAALVAGLALRGRPAAALRLPLPPGPGQLPAQRSPRYHPRLQIVQVLALLLLSPCLLLLGLASFLLTKVQL